MSQGSRMSFSSRAQLLTTLRSKRTWGDPCFWLAVLPRLQKQRSLMVCAADDQKLGAVYVPTPCLWRWHGVRQIGRQSCYVTKSKVACSSLAVSGEQRHTAMSWLMLYALLQQLRAVPHSNHAARSDFGVLLMRSRPPLLGMPLTEFSSAVLPLALSSASRGHLPDAFCFSKLLFFH